MLASHITNATASIAFRPSNDLELGLVRLRYRRGRNERRNEHRRWQMDWNRIEGNWKQTKGKVKEKWGQLTDDDLTQVNGKREQLEGKIQERYGLAKDKARTDVDDWLSSQP
jgi:uncharacterized protein YjbJ (UPF0337 family)